MCCTDGMMQLLLPGVIERSLYSLWWSDVAWSPSAVSRLPHQTSNLHATEMPLATNTMCTERPLTESTVDLVQTKFLTFNRIDFGYVLVGNSRVHWSRLGSRALKLDCNTCGHMAAGGRWKVYWPSSNGSAFLLWISAKGDQTLRLLWNKSDLGLNVCWKTWFTAQNKVHL